MAAGRQCADQDDSDDYETTTCEQFKGRRSCKHDAVKMPKMTAWMSIWLIEAEEQTDASDGYETTELSRSGASTG